MLQIFSNFFVIFLLFLLQFVYFPVGISFFEGSKVYIVELCVFVLLVIQVISGDFFLWKKKKFFLLLSCFLVVLSLYHMFFNHHPNTFWGNSFRMQGTLLLWFLLVFALVSSFVKVKHIPFFFLLFVMLVQLYLVFAVNSGNLGRAIGSMGEPNSLAGEMVFLWPFIFMRNTHILSKKPWPVVLYLLVWLFVGIVVFLSGSRSGFIAFFLQLALFVFVKLFHLSYKSAVLICSIFLLLSYSLPFIERGGLYENRVEVWESAVSFGLSHPLIGIGFGNVEYALHDEDLRLGNHLQGYYVDSSHNIFLDLFIEGGLLGLGLFCTLLCNSFIVFVKRGDLTNLLFLFGLLGILSFNPVSVVLLVAFWWVIGQSL